MSWSPIIGSWERPQVKHFRPPVFPKRFCIAAGAEFNHPLKDLGPWSWVSVEIFEVILWSKGKTTIFEGCIQLHHDTPGNKPRHWKMLVGSGKLEDYFFLEVHFGGCMISCYAFALGFEVWCDSQSKSRTSESQRFGLWSLFQSDLWPHVFSVSAQFDIGSRLWPESGRCGLG